MTLIPHKSLFDFIKILQLIYDPGTFLVRIVENQVVECHGWILSSLLLEEDLITINICNQIMNRQLIIL